MKRTYLLLLLTLSAFSMAFAAGFPQISSGNAEYYYYLKFTRGDYVVKAQGEAVVCTSALPTGKASQLWKVEGTADDGYTFTNKLGQQLYVSATSQGGEVRAAKSPSSLNRFSITASGSNYVISPQSNSAQALNCWGGMGLGNDIKLYQSSDANAPMTFLAEGEAAFGGTQNAIIPYPYSLTQGSGASLDLHQVTAITYDNVEAQSVAQQFATDLQRTSGIALQVRQQGEKASSVADVIISLTTDNKLPLDGYTLRSGDFGVEIAASGFGGFFYALQTLRQMIGAKIYGNEKLTAADWSVQPVTITDRPNMPYRGFHLDVSRHFFDKDEVKKLIDAASLYKLNRFHWHLTDDQGWRIEIPEYPKLTTVGAVRSRSLTINDPTQGAEFYDDTEYGRGLFYTLDDLREIVAYAKARNIEIIPEVDMPGHMVAAIAAYPELSCDTTKKYEVRTTKGVSTEILNVGKDEVIDFLKCVMGHVAEVFPYELVHIGGDECPTTAWQNNADCSRRIAEEGLSGVNDLQPWLVEKIGSFLRDNYGKRVLIWDDFVANWNSRYTIEPVVMIWRGTGDPSSALAHNFQSVMVPSYPLYFDLLQISPDKMEIDAPYYGGYGDRAVNTVERVYAFNPVEKASGKENLIIGTQANLWTESCATNEAAEYMIFPRLLALSEMAWLPSAKKNFSDFYIRLQKHAAVLDAKNIVYAKHYIEAPDLSEAEQALAEAETLMAESRPGQIGYPSQEAANSLASACSTLKADVQNSEKLQALQTEIANYKAAPICMPKNGDMCRIVSASTYFRNHFVGSTLYDAGDGLRIHYTEQVEPEELWKFVVSDDGSIKIANSLSGNFINIRRSANAAVTTTTSGTVLSIRKATKPAGGYSYIPGVVNIKSGNFNLTAQMSGNVVSATDSTLCYPGTWRFEMIDNAADRLQGLLDKAKRIIEGSNPQEIGQPTDEALQFLQQSVVQPALSALQLGNVSWETYNQIAAQYAIFKQMPTVSPLDVISEGKYYLLQNAYFTDYYACASSASATTVDSKTLGSADGYKWSVQKNGDGSVSIENKATRTKAYVSSNAENQQVRLGRAGKWRIEQISTDTGGGGIGLITSSGNYSWYTNPSAWTYVLLKPSSWGASVWRLIDTGEDITAIGSVKREMVASQAYDLLGKPLRGETSIYIKDGRKLMAK